MIDSKNSYKKAVIKNVFMFCFYFIYEIIPLYILKLFNIDSSSLSSLNKNIYLISTSIIYLIFVIFMYKKELKIDFNKLKGKFIDNIVKYVPYYIVGVLLMAISNIIISKFTNVNLSENEINVRNYIQLFPIYMTFSTVIYAPIVEEITFRKTFRNIINNKFLFIILSGVVFGVVHLSSPSSINDYLMIIPYILMGITLSYIYYKSDNILTTMSLHGMHNLILLIFQFIL